MLRALVVLVVALLASPAFGQDLGHGWTCDQVRKLTRPERWFWIKRYGLNAADVGKIRERCRIK